MFGYPGQHPEDPIRRGRRRRWRRRGCAMALTWCSGGSSRKCPSSGGLFGSKRQGSGWIRSCWRPGWSGAGRAALRWSLHRCATIRGSAATRSATMISSLATIPTSADARMRRIFAKSIPATTPATRRRRRGIASSAPGSRLVPKWRRVKQRPSTSRGLMFVCYQTSIERQFEYIQRHANDPKFVSGKQRPGGGAVTPGY